MKLSQDFVWCQKEDQELVKFGLDTLTTPEKKQMLNKDVN